MNTSLINSVGMDLSMNSGVLKPLLKSYEIR